MSIEAHCPNPACARVHLVKDRYAGMRGKCPVCSSWMYVPKVESRRHSAQERPRSLDEVALPPVSPSGPSDQDATSEERPLAKQAVKPNSSAEPKVVAQVVEPVGEEPSKPRSPFSWTAALWCFLAVLGLDAVAVAPYTEIPSITASGELADKLTLEKPKGIEKPLSFFVSMGAAGLAIVVLVGLLIWRLGLLRQFLLYLAALGCAALLTLGTYKGKVDSAMIERQMKYLDAIKERGVQGEATVQAGLQYYLLFGGAGVAVLCLGLGLLAWHRRWWSRTLSFIVLVVLFAIGPTYLYRDQLEITEYIPEEVRDLLPY